MFQTTCRDLNILVSLFSLGGALTNTDNSCIQGQSFAFLMHLLEGLICVIGMVMQCTDSFK